MDDIEAATAVEADVLAPETFLAGDKTLRTGTGVPGVDVSDADAAVGDVKSPKTFYSVAAPRKTGTMPTVAIVAANDDYSAGYHAGNAGGLDAIDTDLAPANIKQGVTIFGKAGTLALVHDAQNVNADSFNNSGAEPDHYEKNISAGGRQTLGTATFTCLQATVIEAGGGGQHRGNVSNKIKLQLVINYTQVAESAYLSSSWTNKTLMGSLAVSSGSRTVYIRAKNYDSSSQWLIHVGSVVFGGCGKL